MNPLVTSEVDNAVRKAQYHGVTTCFTTNFLDVAVLDGGPGYSGQPMRRLQGGVVNLISKTLASSDLWWTSLSSEHRSAAVEDGLRRFFERLRLVSRNATPQTPVDEVTLGFFSDLTVALLGPLHRELLRTRENLSATMEDRALAVGLDPSDDQDCRYLVAQGIAEVLSAALFHRLLQDHFRNIAPLLRGTAPSSGRVLVATANRSFEEAIRLSGDYKPILLLSEVARWSLRNAPSASVAHWLALFGFIEHLDLTAISSDVLGSIFERLISPERRHEMGQHYTQPRIARSMATWGVRSSKDSVLDPACGAGTFLVETYTRHEAVGLTHDEILKHTFGNDLDPFAVHLASINLVTRSICHGLNHPMIRLGDAFDLGPHASMLHVNARDSGDTDRFLEPVDLVIANPPYSRNHPREAWADLQLRKLGLRTLPSYQGINMAAWFVLLGAALKKPEGRMAFVLPSAVLQNENLTAWRRWARERFDIVIWHTEHDIWFSDARVAPCVVLFSPRIETQLRSELGTAHFVNVRELLSGELLTEDGIPVPATRCEVRDLSHVRADDDLLIAGTVPKALRRFAALRNVTKLGCLDKVELAAGQKLGHKFFRLDDAEPESSSVMRTVMGLGSTFKVNRCHLTPLLRGPKDLHSGDPRLTSSWLLTLDRTPPKAQGLVDYLALAKSQDVNNQASVRARGEAWWSLSPRLADVAVPMSSQFRHQVAWLDPAGAVTNNFNVLRADRRSDAELIGASIASAFGALARLYVSGEVGCEGARRVLLVQFATWPVLDPRNIESAQRRRCIEAYRAFRSLPASELDRMSSEETAAFRELTIAVAAIALGAETTEQQARSIAEQAIKEVRSTVLRRRELEAQALEGRTRQVRTTGASLSQRVRRWARDSETYRRSVELMCAGPAILQLRSVKDIDSPRMFERHPFDVAPQEEHLLVDLLGTGFKAAWPDPTDQADELNELVDVLSKVAEQLVLTLISGPPLSGTPERTTWNRLRAELITGLRRSLSGDVKRALA